MDSNASSIGLDNPVFSGRLRVPTRPVTPRSARATAVRTRFVTEDIQEQAVETVPALAVEAPSATIDIPDASHLTQPEAKTSALTPQTTTPLVKEDSEDLVPPLRFQFEDIDQDSYTRKTHYKRHYRGVFVSRVLVGLAVLLLLAGSYVVASGYRTNKTIGASNNNAAVGGEDKPDETEPTEQDINTYTVAPDQPRFITIDKVSKKARVRSVGINATGQIQTPSNVFDAGWYADSVKPGSPGGASVIDGHVSGFTEKGVFYELKNAQNGDIITVELGSGQVVRYKVVAKETYAADKVDMAKVLVAHNTAKHGLNLITCTGSVQGMEYSHRLVVFTEAIS